MSNNIIDNSDAIIYQDITNVGQYGDCGIDVIDVNDPSKWVEDAQQAAQDAIEAAEKAAEEADRAQEIADNLGDIADGSGSIVFDTVADMVKDDRLKGKLDKNMRVSTLGYYSKSGYGGATYDIWDKDDFKNHIGPRVEWDDATGTNKEYWWYPDNVGDHEIEGSNNVAILRNNGKFWANQLGLLDPVEDELDARAKGVTHHQTLQAAAEHVKRRLDTLHRAKGDGIRHILVLHIESGRYVLNGTVFMPAGVFLCGGSDWGQQPSVEMIPMKNLEPGEDNIQNYYPKPGIPVLKSIWEPDFDGTDGRIATSPTPYKFDGGVNKNRGGYFSGFVKVHDANRDQTLFSYSGDIGTKVYWSAADQGIKCDLNVHNSDGSIQAIKFNAIPIEPHIIDGGSTVGIYKNVYVDKTTLKPTRVVWRLSVGGKKLEIDGNDLEGYIYLDSMYNDVVGNQCLNGSIEYPLSGEVWPLDNSTGEEIDLTTEGEEPLFWIYGPGTITSADMPTIDFLDQENVNFPNSDWKLLGFGSDDMWRVRTVYDYNDRTGFMFVWNSKQGSDNVAGIVPAENVYLDAYTGGASGITLSNYETNPKDYVPGTMNPSGEPDLDCNWKGNYLRYINGFMTFGSGYFVANRSERISTVIHRPSYDVLGEYYTDRTFIQDLECGIQRENDRWAIDINGAGDATTMINLSFPVNHPSPWNYGSFYPCGEYADGPAKAIKFQTTAYENPNWKSFVGASTAGATISRIINGSVKLMGTRNITISDSHFEFGNIILDDATANIDNCYFSQLHDANYPDIDMRAGMYSNSSKTVTIRNCEFHRGYDGAHWPDSKWNIITSPTHTVHIQSATQGWSLSGLENQEVAPTIGYRHSLPKDLHYPNEGDMPGVVELPGWSRWAPHLRDFTIIRGHIVPQTIYRTLDSFSGIGDTYVQGVPDFVEDRYWQDVATGKPYPWGDYYYNAQWLLDRGDDVQRVLDPDFIPLGRNPNIGTTVLGAERKVSVFPDGSADKPGARPILTIYAGGQDIPAGWVRFYRGTSPGHYTHYVDIPSYSISGFDDTGSQMYRRDWIKYDYDWDENPNAGTPLEGTSMFPVYQPELDKVYALEMKGGAYLKEGEDPLVTTGGWKLFDDERYEVFKGTNHSNPVRPYIKNSVGIWTEKDFTDHSWVQLPVTGDKEWDGTNTFIPEGAKTTLIRDKSAGNEKFDLIINYSGGDPSIPLATLKPGQSVTCVYAAGGWHAVDWGGADKDVFYHVSMDNVGEGINLQIPGAENYLVTFDSPIAPEGIGPPQDRDLWYGLPLNAKLGTKVTFACSARSGFYNYHEITHPLKWNRVILTYTPDRLLNISVNGSDSVNTTQGGSYNVDVVADSSLIGETLTFFKTGNEDLEFTDIAPVKIGSEKFTINVPSATSSGKIYGTVMGVPNPNGPYLGDRKESNLLTINFDSKAEVLSKNTRYVGDTTEYVGILSWPGDHFTAVMGENGWFLSERAEQPTHHFTIDFASSQDSLGLLTPVDGVLKQVNHINQNISQENSKELWLQLTAQGWALQPVVNGAEVKVQLGPEWKPGEPAKIVLQTKYGSGDEYKTMYFPGDFLEFRWNEEDDDYNKPGSDGKWQLIDSHLGTDITLFNKDFKSGDISFEFKDKSKASNNSGLVTSYWTKDLASSLYFKLPDSTPESGDDRFGDLKPNTRYKFITGLSDDSYDLVIIAADDSFTHTLPKKGCASYIYLGDKNWMVEDWQEFIIP